MTCGADSRGTGPQGGKTNGIRVKGEPIALEGFFCLGLFFCGVYLVVCLMQFVCLLCVLDFRVCVTTRGSSAVQRFSSRLPASLAERVW